MEKQKLITLINEIISDYGFFQIGDIESYSSPCVNSMGNIVALAEGFNFDYADIEVYDGNSMSSDSISNYTMQYEEMDISTLQTIHSLATKYKEQQQPINY